MLDTGAELSPQPEMQETSPVLSQAKKLIQKYLPIALPQEQTFLIIRRSPSYDPQTRGGEYFGKFGGVHYVELVTPNALAGKNEFSTEPDLEDIDAVVHELIHQRHAEVTGRAFMGWKRDPHIPDDIQKRTPDTMSTLFINAIVEEFDRNKPNGYNIDTLWDVITEGVACLGELIILDKASRDPNPPTDATPDHLTELKTKRMSKISSDRRSEFGRHYSKGLFKVMRKLRKAFGDEALPTIIANVDLDRCRRIPADSITYQEMVNNPTLIPGIKK